MDVINKQNYLRGARGATTIEENSIEALKAGTLELFSKMIEENEIDFNDIANIFFTLTDDLNCAYPARFVREEFNIKYAGIMCYQELKIQGALEKCLRILINFNTEKKQSDIKHIYLKGAKALRKDIVAQNSEE